MSRLSDEGEVINSGDGLENLGIVVEWAAGTRGQDVPFFEVSEGMFDNNSAASKFGITGFSAKLLRSNDHFEGLDSLNRLKSEQRVRVLQFYEFQSRGYVLHRA